MGKINTDRVDKRKKRVRGKIFGTKSKPRISVFASNIYIYVQMINDAENKTMLEFSSLKMARSKSYKKEKKTIEAKKVGLELAKKAKEKGVGQGVFDRGKYSYKGRVKALAEGLREGGLKI